MSTPVSSGQRTLLIMTTQKLRLPEVPVPDTTMSNFSLSDFS